MSSEKGETIKILANKGLIQMYVHCLFFPALYCLSFHDPKYKTLAAKHPPTKYSTDQSIQTLTLPRLQQKRPLASTNGPDLVPGFRIRWTQAETPLLSNKQSLSVHHILVPCFPASSFARTKTLRIKPPKDNPQARLHPISRQPVGILQEKA